MSGGGLDVGFVVGGCEVDGEENGRMVEGGWEGGW